jgi:2-oxo-4-hydroxy-4-carboxy-5-ureidoimidazoline decarboxylase
LSGPSLAGISVPALEPAAFLARFGHLFEHSPWVVERAAALGPFVDGEALLAAFAAVVGSAGKDAQLDLVRRHPELADKAAIDARALTPESASEQAGAGLDRLSSAEYEAFHALNRAYRERFGFPFVICVRLYDKAGILAALKARTAGDDDELGVALENILMIVRFRLADALGVV